MLFLKFSPHSNLKYGFSNRKDGSMHRHLEMENRVLYFRRMTINPSRVVTADLVHGGRVERVGDTAANTFISNSDGLITNTENLFLSATGADCFLLYFYDPKKNAVGITHVGWRGLLAGVVKNTAKAFVKSFDTSPQELLIGISPGIRACHFEISSSDKIQYQKYPSFIFERDNKVFVDLAGIIKSQLLDKGVLKKHIEDNGRCTYCNEEEFFSYRRDTPKEVQPMIGYIGLI